MKVLPAIIIFVGWLLPAAVFAQVQDKDKTDASIAAKQFIQSFRRVQDVTPLLDQYFTKDFLSGIERDGGHNSLAFVQMADLLPGSKKPAIRLTAAQQKRYYVESTNFFFFVWLYGCWKDPRYYRGHEDDKSPPLPDGVKSLLRQSLFFNIILRPNSVGEMTETEAMKMIPRSAADVEGVAQNLSEINALYRKNMSSLVKLSDADFDDLVLKCQDPYEPELYAVQMANCTDKGNCPGFPKGTPLIGVRAPAFDYIDFARVDDKMRIVRLFLWDESLTGK